MFKNAFYKTLPLADRKVYPVDKTPFLYERNNPHPAATNRTYQWVCIDHLYELTPAISHFFILILHLPVNNWAACGEPAFPSSLTPGWLGIPTVIYHDLSVSGWYVSRECCQKL